MSEPLVQSLTKNLKPCSGCGGMSSVRYFFEQAEKGETMTFIIQVEVEANSAREAANQIPDNLTVISVNPRPQTPVGRVAGNSPQAQPNVTIMPQPTQSTVFQHPG